MRLVPPATGFMRQAIPRRWELHELTSVIGFASQMLTWKTYLDCHKHGVMSECFTYLNEEVLQVYIYIIMDFNIKSIKLYRKPVGFFRLFIFTLDMTNIYQHLWKKKFHVACLVRLEETNSLGKNGVCPPVCPWLWTCARVDRCWPLGLGGFLMLWVSKRVKWMPQDGLGDT